MVSARRLSSDLRGARRLAIEATLGVTDLVEAVHRTVTRVPLPVGRPVEGRTTGITGLVYRSVRGITRLVDGSLEAGHAVLDALIPEGGDLAPLPVRERIVSALNGVLGDHLERTGNPLAIPMEMRHRGEALCLERAALARAVPGARGWLLVALHGLCMNDLQWTVDGKDRAARLAAALGATPLHLRYNSGLHVSTNGRALAELLEALMQAWPVPVERITLLGHSMGGLLARSAQQSGQAAGLAWTGRLRDMVFLGTPHHGAPLERGGHGFEALLGVSPYSAAFQRLGRVRSAGITDLRHGSLLDSDWEGGDRFAHDTDARTPVPLPEGVDCFAIAATLGSRQDPLARRLLGDGLVPLDSALGRHPQPRRRLAFPPGRTRVAYRTGHLGLLASDAAFRRVERWLAGEAPAPAAA